MFPGRKTILAASGGCLLAGVLTIGAYAGEAMLTGNFGTVVPGEAYRSAQLGNKQLRLDVRRYGIRTIINLRGANPGQRWYEKEVADARTLGIGHIDFRMSAKRQLTQAQVQDLIELMAKAPKPLLIHCSSGSDRTGLAAALYVASIAKLGEEAAESQLSVRFGHLSLPFVKAYAMDETWERIEPWLGFTDS